MEAGTDSGGFRERTEMDNHKRPGASYGSMALLREDALLALKGVCMGAADVVPGVSGGTMAFILGIYERLIHAIRSFDAEALKMILKGNFRGAADHVAWRFLLALGIGILTAIFSLARLLSWLLRDHPIFIWSFFFGLIVASVVVVGRRVSAWRPLLFVTFIGGLLGAYWLVGLVPVAPPDAPWYLFMSGAVAICAMILPGISGSFVLVLLGKYQTVLDAVNERDMVVLGLLALGACVGLAAFSRLLGWLLDRYHDAMVAVLTGLMLGSLRKVWPWKEAAAQINALPPQWNGEVLGALLLMMVGFVLVLGLDRLAVRSA